MVILRQSMDVNSTATASILSLPPAPDPQGWLQASKEQRYLWVAQTLLSEHQILWALCEARLHVEFGEKKPSRHTFHTYRMGLKQYLRFLLDTDANLMTLPPVQEYADWLSHQGRAAMTVRTRVAAAQLFIRSLDWSGFNMTSQHRSYTDLPNFRHKTQKKAYTSEEIAKLLEHADPEEAVIVRLGSELGLRAGEMLSLQRVDVKLTLPASITLRTGSKEWVLPISDPLRLALERWLEAHTLPNIILGQRTNYISAVLQRLCSRVKTVEYGGAGVEGLRLAAGRRVWQETGDPIALKAFLRLKSNVTLDKYMQGNPEKL